MYGNEPVPVPRLAFRVTGTLLDVLSVFALAGDGAELWGLDALCRANRLSGGLDVLEGTGWLTSRWEPLDPGESVRARRRLYRLSDGGKGEAVRLLDERRPGWRTDRTGSFLGTLVYRLLDRHSGRHSVRQ